MRGGRARSRSLSSDSDGEEVTDVTLTTSLQEAGPAELESFREHGFFDRAEATPYVADVQVTTGDGQFGTASCEAWYVTERAIDTPPGGSGA